MTKPFDPFNQCTEYYHRIEKLLADNTALKAENARLKTVPMKYRRMAFNAQLQDENHELHAQLAVAQEQLAIRTQEFDAAWRQLAKAEQRVAEAIVDMLQQKHRNCFGAHSFYSAASVATANGEWRKFMKEV